MFLEPLERRELMTGEVTMTSSATLIAEAGGEALFRVKSTLSHDVWLNPADFPHTNSHYNVSGEPSAIYKLEPNASFEFTITAVDDADTADHNVMPTFCWYYDDLCTNPKLGPPISAKVSIIDDDGPATVKILNAERVDEGQALIFQAYVSGAYSSPVTATASTSDGTAIGGADYASESLELRFVPGFRFSEVWVETKQDDTIGESLEDLDVNLSNVSSNATIAIGTATGEINDVVNSELFKTCCGGCPNCPKTEVTNPVTGTSAWSIPGGLLFSVGSALTAGFVSFNASLPSSFSGATSLTMRSKVNGTVDSALEFNTTGFTSGSPYRFNFQPSPSLMGSAINVIETTFEAVTAAGTQTVTAKGKALAPAVRSGVPAGANFYGMDMLETNGDSAAIRSCCGDAALFRKDSRGNYQALSGDARKRTLKPAAGGGYIAQEKDGSATKFNALGMPEKVEDASGNWKKFTYVDADGDGDAKELSSVVESTGETTTYSYSGGLLDTVTTGDGQTISYEYDSEGRFLSITEPDPDGVGVGEPAPVTTFQWNSTSGELDSITDPTGRVTAYDYDAAGRVSKVYKDGTLVSDAVSYASLGYIDQDAGVGTSSNKAPLVNVASEYGTKLDGLGHESKFKTDQFGLPSEMQNELGETTHIERNSDGLVTRIVGADPDGTGTGLPAPETTNEYYPGTTNLKKTTYPDATYETWEYDSLWNVPTKYTDRRGFVTLYSIDSANGHVLSVREIVGDNDLTSSETNDVVTSFTYTPVAYPAVSGVLQVSDFEVTTTGVRFEFNQQVDLTQLNLYDYKNPSNAWVLGAADVQLVGASAGAIKGSLVMHPGDREFTFVASNGLLPADSYTLTLRSAANGFTNREGGLLDGDASGTAGGDYVETFTVSSSSAAVVGIPSFSRGPQQPVKIPVSEAGLPITLGNVSSVTDMNFELAFDHRILEISGVALATGTGLPFGSSLTWSRTDEDSIHVWIHFGSPVSYSGTATIASVTASVPLSAALRYGSTAVLDLNSLALFNSGGGSIAAVDDDGIQVNRYLGEINGNGIYDSVDANQVSRLALDIDTGFQYVPTIDSNVLADFNQNDRIDSFDSSVVFVHSLGYTNSLAPPLPSPLPKVMVDGASLSPAGLVATMTDALGRVTEYEYDRRGNLTHTRYAVGTSVEADTVQIYDTAKGRLLQSWDELERLTSYTYDSLNRVSTITLPDPDGAGSLTSPVYEYAEYDGMGRLVKIYDPLDRLTEYEYDDENRTYKVYLPDHDGDGQRTLTTYQYDEANRLAWVTDPLGRKTEYEYDDAGRLTATTLPDPDGTGTTYTSPVLESVYDHLGVMKESRDGLARSTLYPSFDFINRTQTILQADPDGASPFNRPTTVVTSDANGNVTSTVDPLGRETTTTYDRFNRPLVVQSPDPVTAATLVTTSVSTYDKVGNLKTVTDALNNVTEYFYDARNRRIRMLQADPDGELGRPETLYVYDAAGQLTAVTDPNGHTTSYAYDKLGRQTSVTAADPDGSGPLAAPVTTYAYDAVGRMTAMTDPRSHTTNYEYDDLDHRTKVIEPDADGVSPINRPTTEFVYDAAGQLLSVTDPLGRETVYEYDALGRRTKMTQPDPDGPSNPLTAPVTTYTYDAANNLLTQTDPRGKVTTFEYDDLNRRVKTIAPDDNLADSVPGPTTSYAYDAVGQLTSVTDPMFRTEYYSYFNNGWKKSVTRPDPDGAAPYDNLVTQYTYDAVGNLLTVTDPLERVTTNYYDHLHRLWKTEQPDPDGAGTTHGKPTTLYSYDAVGNRLSLTDPVGNRTEWTYDGLNRVSEQTNQLGFTWSFQYDANGNLQQKVNRLGRLIAFEYDNLDRRTEENWLESSSSTVNVGSLTYEYDLGGRLVSAATTQSRDGVTTATNNYFSYDDLDRVRTETQNPGLGPTAQFEYTYDANGNRLSSQASVLDGATYIADYQNEYAYDGLNRLKQLLQHGVSGGATVADKRFDFTYNLASQFDSLTRFYDLAGADLVAVTNYAYDPLARLKDLHHSQGSTTLARYQYVYDAQGRIESIDSHLDGVTNYSYDDTDQLTGAENSTLSQNDEYSYDENGNRTLAGHVVGPNNQLLSDGVYVYTYDAEGNRSARINIATAARTEYIWDYRNRLIQVRDYDDSYGFGSGAASSSASGAGDGYTVQVTGTAEGSGTATLRFEIPEEQEDDVTISYWTELETAVNGVDYTLAPGSLTIPAGQTSVSLTFPVSDDSIAEGTETFALRYKRAVESAAHKLVVSILDNDGGAGSGSGSSYGSASGYASVGVSGSGSSGGSSSAFASGYGSFAASASGSGSASYSNSAAGSASFYASVTPSAQSSSGSGDGVTAYLSNNGEGSGYGSIYFELATAESSDVVIEYWVEDGSADEGTDFSLSSGTATIYAYGTSSSYFGFSITDDSIVEGGESFTFHFRRYGTSGDYTVSHTIDDNDAWTWQSFSVSATSYSEGDSVAVTIYPPYLPYSVDVELSLVSGSATAGTDFSSSTTTVTVPAYSMYYSTSLSTYDDSLTEGTEYFSVRYQFVGSNVSSSYAFEVYQELADNDGPPPMETDSFFASATAYTEGSNIDFSVSVYRPYESQVTVYLISGGATVGSDLPGDTYTFTIPAYTWTSYFTIPTYDDSTYEGAESFTLRMQFTGDYSSSSTYDLSLDLYDNDTDPTPVWGTAMFGASAAVGREGDDVYVGVSYTSYQTLAMPAVVKVWLVPDEAGYDDFTDEVYEIEFPANNSWGYGTVQLPTFADSLWEGTEHFKVRIQWDSEWANSSVYEIDLDLIEDAPGWSHQIDYFYDQDNRLVARQERDGDAPEVAATDAFYYDDKQIVLKTHEGELVNRLVWGPQVDMLLADEQLDPALETAAVLYPLTDHLGTTRDLAVYDEGTGDTSIASHRVFDAFGNLVSEADADFDTEFKFTGRYFDEATGQQWNLNRWYDPKIGQWLNEDPIAFEAGDQNLRRYVGGGAINNTDPDGNQAQPVNFQPSGGELITEASITLLINEEKVTISVWKNSGVIATQGANKKTLPNEYMYFTVTGTKESHLLQFFNSTIFDAAGPIKAQFYVDNTIYDSGKWYVDADQPNAKGSNCFLDQADTFVKVDKGDLPKITLGVFDRPATVMQKGWAKVVTDFETYVVYDGKPVWKITWTATEVPGEGAATAIAYSNIKGEEVKDLSKKFQTPQWAAGCPLEDTGDGKAKVGDPLHHKNPFFK